MSTTSPEHDTDPPKTSPKPSSKPTLVVGIVILVVLWAVFGFMRKPGSVSTIMNFEPHVQQTFVFSDGQGQGGQTTEVTEEMKAARSAEPQPMGKKGIWYTFYPPMDDDAAIKKEVKGGNGWSLVNEAEQHYTWKGKYDIKLRAPATTKDYDIGIQFMENDLGVGGSIGLTLKNMLP